MYHDRSRVVTLVCEVEGGGGGGRGISLVGGYMGGSMGGPLGLALGGGGGIQHERQSVKTAGTLSGGGGGTVRTGGMAGAVGGAGRAAGERGVTFQEFPPLSPSPLLRASTYVPGTSSPPPPPPPGSKFGGSVPWVPWEPTEVAAPIVPSYASSFVDPDGSIVTHGQSSLV